MGLDGGLASNGGQSASVASASSAAGPVTTQNGLTLQNVPGLAQPLPALRNPSHLRRWRAAAATAMFALCRTLFLGDSITVGDAASNTTTSTAADQLLWAQRGHVAQLRTLLQQRIGQTAGEGLLTFGTDEGRWTYSGTHPSGATGPALTGTTLAAAGSVSGTFKFSQAVIAGFYSTSSSIPTYQAPSRVLAGSTDVTPTMLTAAQASYTVGAGNWANDANCTPTATTDAGENVLQLTSAASGAMSARTPTGTSGIVCAAGQVLWATGEFKAAATPQQVQVSVNFYDASGAAVGSQQFSPAVTDAVGSYIQSSIMLTAPALTAFANIVARVVTTSGASEVHTVRRLRLIPLTMIAGGGNAKLWKFTTNAVTDASQTLQIDSAPNVASGSGGVATGLAWAMLLEGTAGHLVHRLGKSGSTSADWAATAQISTTQTNMLIEALDLVGPDLCVITLGVNDSANQGTNSITPTVFLANITLLAARVIAAGGCVLFVAGPRLASETSPFTQQNYYDQIKAYSDATDHVAYLDITDVWGTEANSEEIGLQNHALYGVHPTLAGHGDMARMIYNALTTPYNVLHA